MQQRERILAIVLVVGLGGWLVVPTIYSAILGPLDDARTRIQLLDRSQETLDTQQLKMQIAQRHMREWKDRSLPPDPLEAQRLYQEWLTDLGQLAGISSLRVAPQPLQATTNAYQSVRIELKGEATFDQLLVFLHYFERIDLLHRLSGLKVETPPSNPNAPFKITMIAEGLCLPGAQSREHLFAQTQLADSLPRSFANFKVVAVDEFPKECPFDVRIGEELLTVTKVAGSEWTASRAVNGTSIARHEKGAAVEYFPIRYDRKDLNLADQKKALANHPFSRPPGAAPTIAEADDIAAQTKLISSITDESEQSAMLYNQRSNTKTPLRKGSSITVGDIKGTVVSIDSDCVQIDRGGQLWQVNLGKSLRSMTRVGTTPEDDLTPDFQMDMPRRGPGGTGRSGGRGGGGDRSRRSRRFGGPAAEMPPQ